MKYTIAPFYKLFIAFILFISIFCLKHPLFASDVIDVTQMTSMTTDSNGTSQLGANQVSSGYYKASSLWDDWYHPTTSNFTGFASDGFGYNGGTLGTGDVEYGGASDVLPQNHFQPWTTTGTESASVASDILTVVDDSALDRLYYTYSDTNLSSDDQVVVSFRILVNSGPAYAGCGNPVLRVLDGTRGLQIGLQDDQVGFGNSTTNSCLVGEPTYAMDTTDGYHIYTIVKNGVGTVHLYVDGVDRLSTAYTNFTASASTAIEFGAATLSQQSNVSYDYVRYENGTTDINFTASPIASWASENQSATRGTEDAFPTNAYIIGTGGTINILDADTHDLWMRFFMGGGWYLGDGTVTDVNFYEGKLYVATEPSGANTDKLHIVDFTYDRAKYWDSADDYVTTDTVAERHDAVAWTAGSSEGISATDGNAVDVFETGGSTYVAVATDGGAWVVKDEGTVYNQMAGLTTIDVAFSETGALYMLRYDNVPAAAANIYAFYDITSIADPFTPDYTYQDDTALACKVGQSAPCDAFLTDDVNALAVTTDAGSNTLYVASDDGLTIIDTDETNPGVSETDGTRDNWGIIDTGVYDEAYVGGSTNNVSDIQITEDWLGNNYLAFAANDGVDGGALQAMSLGVSNFPLTITSSLSDRDIDVAIAQDTRTVLAGSVSGLDIVSFDRAPDSDLSSPSDAAVDESFTPTLTIASFFDEDGDSHAATRWKISSGSQAACDAGDYDSADSVFDVYNGTDDAVNLTTFAVPGGTLSGNTTYYWKAFVKDDYSTPAYQSPGACYSFTTGNQTPTQSVTLPVIALNEPLNYEGDSCTAVSYNLNSYFTDADGDALSYTLIDTPTLVDAGIGGTTLSVDCIGSNNTGSDTLQVRASDGYSSVDSNSVAVTVVPRDDIPDFSTVIPDQSWDEDDVATIDLSTYFSDPDDDVSTIVWGLDSATTPEDISATFSGTVATLTPDTDFSGSENIIFTAADPDVAGESASSNTVSLTVGDTNDAPPAVTSGWNIADGAVITDTTPTFSWTAVTDPDGDDVSYALHLDATESAVTTGAADIQLTTNTTSTSVRSSQALTVGETYYYAVQAIDEYDSASDWSEVRSFSVASSDTTSNLTVTKSVGINESAALNDYQHIQHLSFYDGLFSQFVHYASAEEEKSLVMHSELGLFSRVAFYVFSFLAQPTVTYFLLGVLLASLLYGFAIARGPIGLFHLLFFKSTHSFAKLAPKDKKGTYRTSYHSHKKKARVSKGTIFGALFFFVAKVVSLSILSSYFFGQLLPILGSDGTPVQSGDLLTYRMTYVNTGDASVTDLVISDSAPEGTTLVTNSITSSDENVVMSVGNDGVITFNIGGVLQNSDPAYVQFNVIVSDEAIGTDVINSASYSSSQDPDEQSTNMTTNPVEASENTNSNTNSNTNVNVSVNTNTPSTGNTNTSSSSSSSRYIEVTPSLDSGEDATQTNTNSRKNTNVSQPVSHDPRSLHNFTFDFISNFAASENDIVIHSNILVFSGHAKAGTRVTLFIYSDPLELSTVANEDDFWEITVDTALLTVGDHTVLAQTEKDGVKSDLVEIAKFTVVTQEKDEVAYYSLLGLLVLVLVVTVIAIRVFFSLRTKKNTKDISHL